MSMTNEQQEKLLLGLKTEVLELKEILADEYYNKSDISGLNLVSSYDLTNALNNSLSYYLTSDKIKNTFKTIVESDAKDDELWSELERFVTRSELNGKLADINEDIVSINELLSAVGGELFNLDDYYTKNEIDTKNYLTEHQNIAHLATMDWVESKNYLTEHQSLASYATKSWVNNQLSNIDNGITLDGYALFTDIPTNLSDLNNDCGFITEHQSLSEYVKIGELKPIKNSITVLGSKISSILSSEYITIDDVENYIETLCLDTTYAKLTDIPSLDDYHDFKTRIESLIPSFITIDDVRSYVYKQKYAKQSDLVKYDTLIDGVNESIDSVRVLFDSYAKNSDLNRYLLKSDYESSVSEYVTSLDVETLVDGKLNQYVKLSDFNDYIGALDLSIIVNHINDNRDKIEVIEGRLTGFATKDYVSELVDGLVSPDVLDGYVTSGDLLDFHNTISSEFVKFVDIENLVTYNDIDSDFVKKCDIEDYIPSVTSFVKKSDLVNSLKPITTDIESITSDILKNIGDIQTIKESIKNDYYDKELIDEKIDSIYDRIDNSLGNSTSNTEVTSKYDLTSYAKKSDLKVLSDSLVKYAKLSDVPDVSEFVRESTFDASIEDLYSYINDKTSDDRFNKSEYYDKSAVDSIASSLRASIKNSGYVTKSELNDRINGIQTTINQTVVTSETCKFDETKYYDKNKVDSIVNSLRASIKNSGYAKSSDIDEINDRIDSISELFVSSETCKFDETKYYDKSKVDSMIAKLKNAVVDKTDLSDKLKGYLNKTDGKNYIETYVKSYVDSYIDNKMSTYLTKNEAKYTYLAIEDYKYIKNAASFINAYENNPEAFFSKLFDEDGNRRTEKLLANGFYVVEDNVYLVYEGIVLEMPNYEYWHTEE